MRVTHVAPSSAEVVADVPRASRVLCQTCPSQPAPTSRPPPSAAYPASQPTAQRPAHPREVLFMRDRAVEVQAV